MIRYVDVDFHDLPRDAAMEAAIHRWVARLGAMQVELRRVQVRIEPAGRRRKQVSLTVWTASAAQTTAATHADAYLAIGHAFRALWQQLRCDAMVAQSMRHLVATRALSNPYLSD